jgi:glycosyltransferase involved in cell wall biosynthesis
VDKSTLSGQLEFHKNNMEPVRPRVLVFSTLFPNAATPNAGVFIRERMFRVGKRLPVTVVSPKPWFPGQGLISRLRPHFRPQAPRSEVQEGVQVLFPRFFSIPGILKSLDGLFLALGSLFPLRRLKKRFDFDVIDSHFAYPDGYAATLLGKWLGVPVTITLRGTEVPQAEMVMHRRLLLKALRRADRVISVSDSLKRHVVALGADAEKIQVVGNGVDTVKFRPVPKSEARSGLGLSETDKVLISVGGLVERKGFHRVIDLLPGLLQRHPDLKYLVVGGPSAEGDWSERLRRQVADLELEQVVRFLGALPPGELKVPLSAADLFVLATSNEGWANVFLEAMACGLPVITTDVGGNREVVCRETLGTVVPFYEASRLEKALDEALSRQWDNSAILGYAAENAWDTRVAVLERLFTELASEEKNKI